MDTFRWWRIGLNQTKRTRLCFAINVNRLLGAPACTTFAVCGKDEESALLQDLLIYATKGIAQYAHRARLLGGKDQTVDRFVLDALFTTVTNVNFDPARIQTLLLRAAAVRDCARALYEQTARSAGKTVEALNGSSNWAPAADLAGLVKQGSLASILNRRDQFGADTTGLQELLTYGLKGTAAYAHNALTLGQESDGAYAFFHEALSYLAQPNNTVQELLGLCLRCGEVNLKVMKLLDTANTSAFGNPRPTAVRVQPLKGKAILVSGHDLRDLELVLQQTEGKGINVYTHSEMLPAHGYPKLKAYKHLVGNYGGAWQDQKDEFNAFPGAILMTTNCIQEPVPAYRDRIFTSGLVAWPGVTHIADGDFTPVIQAALAAPGFPEDGADKTILVGFGHDAVLSVAGQVVEAVKSGAIKRFFLIGGCDGAKTGRDYYTELAESVPTIASSSRSRVANTGSTRWSSARSAGSHAYWISGNATTPIRLSKSPGRCWGFQLRRERSPLSMVLSWYEQKAVCILLTLLHLGVKNIRLGPSLRHS